MRLSACRRPWTILPLNVALGAVADLTDPSAQKRIGTSAQELTGKWDQYKQSGTAPTQRLGAALFELPGLEGFLVPTAVPGISGTNLVVFPEKLNARSRIEFRNQNSGRIERFSHVWHGISNAILVRAENAAYNEYSLQ
jgi:hypothetical protein